MKTFIDQLSTYAKYHRDPRNIATHLIGVPMIVFAVIVLLSKPAFQIAGVLVTPAHFALLMVIAYYLTLHVGFGIVMAVLFGAGIYFAQPLANSSTLIWLSTGVGLFFVGWVIQFIGHYFEGKKPAFVDDIIGLLIGPLFVTAEVLFSLGLCKKIKQNVEALAGPVRKGNSQNAVS